MDIKEEIKRIQEQLDALKKKQEESEKEKDGATLRNGQLYTKGNTDYYTALISCGTFNQKPIWSYTFNDGSGKSFGTSKELVDYLAQDGFRYYGKLKSFTKEQ
jgi:hypothetical protein